MTWPRNPIEHNFDGGREHAADAGLDGAAERQGRGPREISRGRLRQNMFPPPSVAMQQREPDFSRTSALARERRSRVVASAAAEEPSVARATGHQMDLEGQRQRRWTTEYVEGTR